MQRMGPVGPQNLSSLRGRSKLDMQICNKWGIVYNKRHSDISQATSSIRTHNMTCFTSLRAALTTSNDNDTIHNVSQQISMLLSNLS